MAGIRVELELESGEFVTRMVHAGETVRQFNNNVGQGYTQVSKMTEASRGFLSIMRDVTIVLGLAQAAVHNIHNITTGWIGSIVKVNAEMERTQTLLKGMSTAADPVKEAANQVKFLRDFAKDAPFQLDHLTDTFVKLKSTGIDPMNGSLKAIADSIAAFGGGDEMLKRVAVSIQQMSGKGVIQMEELRQQLAEAIPRAVELMARGVGVSTSTLIAKIGKGTVEAKSALNALFGELERTFGGAAQAQMQTFTGMLSQTKTLLQDLALKAGEAGLFDELKKQLKDFNEFLRNSNGAKILADMLGNALTNIVRFLRNTIDVVIEFRRELLTSAQILAGAFATKLAIGALLGLANAISTAVTGVRTFMIAWTAMETAMARNSIAAAVAQIYGMSATLATMGLVARNVGASLSVLSVGLAGLASAALPIAGIIIAAAYAFGLFSNKAREAYEDGVKFQNWTKDSIAKSKQYVAQLQAQLEADKRAVNAIPDSSAAQRARKRRISESLEIAQREADLVEMKKNLLDGEVKAEENAAEKIVRARSAAFDEQQRVAEKKYDQEGVAAIKAHDAEIKTLTDAKKSTEELENKYQKENRARQLAFYDEQLAFLDKSLADVQTAKMTANADEVRGLDLWEGEVLKRFKSVKEQREQLAKTPLGLVELNKALDFEKLRDKATKFLDEIKGKIEGNKAELAGASNEAAKLAYALEHAKFGPAENEKMKVLIEQIKTAQAEYDKLEEELSGRKKLDRDVDAVLKKKREELFELQTKGLSELDKISLAIQQGLYKGVGTTSPAQTALQGIKSSANEAAQGIRNAFGQTSQDAGRGFIGILETINNKWSQFRSNVNNTRPDQHFLDVFGGIDEIGPKKPRVGNNYLTNLFKAESSNNPDAKAATSSAEGLGQFIEETWLQFLKEMHPDVLKVMDKAGQLGLRKNQQLMEEASIWYAQQNAPKLQNAGIDPTDANVYLAHLLGPGGAIAALTQSANTALSSIPQLAKALSANQFLRGMTVGDLQNFASKKFGTGKTVPLDDSGSKLPISPEMGEKNVQKAQEILDLEREIFKLRTDNALTDAQKQIALDIAKAGDNQDGLNKRVAEYRKLITEGKLGADRDPDADRYKNLLKLAGELDAAEKRAADAKKLRQQLEAADIKNNNADEVFEKRLEDLKKRLETQSTFKFSERFWRDFADEQKFQNLYERARDAGIRSQEQYETAVAGSEQRIQRMKEREAGEAFQGQQKKTREIEKSLMTAEQAREAEFEEDMRLLRAAYEEAKGNAELRANIAAELARREIAARRKVAAESPLGRMVKEWADIGNNLQKSLVGWLDGAADKLADFTMTGKADWKSLADSIIKDLIKIGIKAAAIKLIGATFGDFGGILNVGASVATKHGGGMVGGPGYTKTVHPGVFLNARRYHGGGLVDGEVPIIAKKGEEVGWPDQLAKKYGRGNMAMTNTFEINVSGGGGDRQQNADLAAQIGKTMEATIDRKIMGHMTQQMRPGGILHGRGK